MKKISVLMLSLTLCSCLAQQKSQAQFLKKVFKGKKSGIVNTHHHLPITDAELQPKITKDLKYLTSPQLNGRQMGTKGIELAGRYLAGLWQDIGLRPFANKYVQVFSYIKGWRLAKETRLLVDGKYIFMPEQAFPMPFSATGELKKYIIPNTREFGQPWVVPLYQKSSEVDNPAFNWEKSVYSRAKRAQERGAAAILFYENYQSNHPPKYSEQVLRKRLKIPVVVISYKAYREKIKPITGMTPILLIINYKKQWSKAANIVSYLDNGAASDVLICAHYDGYPHESSIMSNGNALDNASGVVTMNALARLLKQSSLKKYNYIFAALSGGTADNIGAEALLKSDVFDKNKVAFVINLDRIGNLGAIKRLYINGASSSLSWERFFDGPYHDFTYILDDSSVSPSDYLPFLEQNIPAVSVSTIPKEQSKTSERTQGEHVSVSDINDVAAFVYGLIGEMNKKGRPIFAPPILQQRIAYNLKHRPRISVRTNRTMTSRNNMSSSSHPNTKYKYTPPRLQSQKHIPKTLLKHPVGIIDDSTYKGYGVRISNIKEQTPAATSGLKSGDIILQMNGTKINRLTDYYNVLNQLKHGQTLVIKVKRGVTMQKFSLIYR